MDFKKIKCSVGLHDWFTEYIELQTGERFPIYRMCNRCGRFEQTGLHRISFKWLQEQSIELATLRARIQLENQLIQINEA